jgi:hypothetical protein
MAVTGGSVPHARARADQAASKTQNGRTIFTESVQALGASIPKWLLALNEGGLGLCLFAWQGRSREESTVQRVCAVWCQYDRPDLV